MSRRVIETVDLNQINKLANAGWHIVSVTAIVIPYYKKHGGYDPSPSATVRYIALVEKQKQEARDGR